MALLNYTTKIDADKTAHEISKILSMHGAKAVMTEYDPKEGLVTAISFKISLNGQDLGFKLPCDWKPVLNILENDPKCRPQYKNQAQAVRTAWRVVKDWIEAQMALVETRMASTEQVFLPYIVTKGGGTLYEKIRDDKFLLGDGK